MSLKDYGLSLLSGHCRWHTIRTWHKNGKYHQESSSDTPSSCPLSSFRPSRNSSLGIYSRYSSQSWEKPGINQVGRPVRRRLQILKIRSCGSALGKEEKQQQHDLREAQPGYEVSWGVAVEDWGTWRDHLSGESGWLLTADCQQRQLLSLTAQFLPMILRLCHYVLFCLFFPLLSLYTTTTIIWITYICFIYIK